VSGATTQRATDPADFGTDKSGVAARWIAEWDLAGKDSARFTKRAREIERRYMDERSSADKDSIRFNVFWSNIQTLRPAIYATPPKPVVQRRYLDQDPVARAASTILQRAIQTNIDMTGWHEVTDQCVLDYLVVGRGTPWARYEPHFEDVSALAVQEGESHEDGMGAPADMGGGMPAQPGAEAALGPEMPGAEAPLDPAMAPDQPAPEPDARGPEDDGLQVTNDAEGQEITYEEVVWDYVNWRDFRHSPARTWQEVRWVGREVLMTLEEGVDRFGAKFRDVPLNWHPEGMDRDDPSFQLFTRARVLEIWDKPSRKVYWICPDYGTAPLDEKPDFLKLNDFFPCPRPLYATINNGSLMPAADLIFYQDQARELDDLTARISNIAKATKVAGVYNAAADGVQRVFNEGVENQAVPVENWGAFTEGGGFKGAMDFLPLEMFVVAMKQLVEVREQTKRDLYEITGISDIVRGQGMANATATAERLKGQFAQLRLRSRVQDVARFCRDMVRITGEIVAKHFQPQTLLLLSDYQQTTGATPDMAMKAIQLLKHDQTRGFRIEIEVDSTVIADQEREQAARVAFLQMAGQFLAEAVPLAQQVPALAQLAAQMLLFGVRGFPIGREMETVFETALEQLQQGASQPQPEQPNPEAERMQAEMQVKQAEMQQRAQADGMKMQLEQAKAEMQARLDEQKLQLEQARLMLDERKIEIEASRARTDANKSDAEMALKSRGMDMEEREKRVERDYSEIQALSGALAQVQAGLDQVAQMSERAMQVASAPRRVTIERGPDGRAIGARQEVEGMA
jgi:hypothetical protein